MKERLIIIGAGELGNQALHYAKLQGKYDVVGFIDDTHDVNSILYGVPVLGGIRDIDILWNNKIFDLLFIAIGYKHFNFRDTLYKSLKGKGYNFGTIIAPHVWIDPTATIGDGCFLYPGVLIEKEAFVGNNVILTVNAMVAHNSKIGDGSFIAGAVAIAGYCKIGNRCMIGVNSTIIDNIEIVDDVVVGAGSVVRKHIKRGGTFVDGRFYEDIYTETR